MTSHAQRLDPRSTPERAETQPGLEIGKVVLHDDNTYSLRIGDEELLARRAYGCLVAPEPGDRVLVARVEGECFILSVLDRTAAGPKVLSTDGELELRAHALTVASKTLSTFAEHAEGKFAKLSVISGAVDTVADRISQRVRRLYRFVDELDQLRAKHFDYRAESTAQLRAETTSITSRSVTRIDGDQVHIG